MSEDQVQGQEPIEVVEIPQNTKATVIRLVRLLFQQKKTILLILCCAIISIGLFAVTPLFSGMIIDRLMDQMRTYGIGGGFVALFTAIRLPVILLLTAYVISSLFEYIQEYAMAGVGEKLVLSLRRQMSEKLNRLPLRYYDSHQTGDTLSRVTNDLDKVAEVLKTGLMQFVTAAANILISVAIMLTQSLGLTAVILVTLSISVFATKWISGKSFASSMENQRTLGELNAKVEEYYSGNLIIKSFNQQEEVIKVMSEVSEQQYQASKKAQFVIYAIYPIIRFLTQLSFVATAIVGGILVINRQMTIGTVQAFLQYVNQISDPITQSSYFITSFQSALAAAERVFQFLDEEEEISEVDSPISIDHPKGEVEFQHVRFGYNPEHILMKDVNFTVKPNEMVAIVGPTGAGKTTLINLLMRFYELDGGKISIDGVDTTTMSKSELRKMVGMVLQDTWLFKGTIAENIAYGKMNAGREEIVAVAKAARCDHFIRTLKDGYDTVISSEDSTLSQGEIQLITIARAMLSNPSLMILDEATSSVDTRTEVEVQKAMARMMEGKTSFVIAHRLSTIKAADAILVMKDGDIIETGTHKELLARKGFYAELYRSQFTG